MFRNSIKNLPQFVKKVMYECDLSALNLSINKTQTNILMCVGDNCEKSMSEISVLTGLEKSSFTRSVDQLVKKGFLEKKSPIHDRRKIKLSLTNKGEKAVKLIRNDVDVYLESLLAGFSEKEKNEFFKSLNTIAKYISKIMEGNKK